jgi:hypothetical protein
MVNRLGSFPRNTSSSLVSYTFLVFKCLLVMQFLILLPVSCFLLNRKVASLSGLALPGSKAVVHKYFLSIVKYLIPYLNDVVEYTKLDPINQFTWKVKVINNEQLKIFLKSDKMPDFVEAARYI